MALMSSSMSLLLCFIILVFVPGFYASDSDEKTLRNSHASLLSKSDIDLVEFPLNLEYFEAEFFLWGALGYGLDVADPSLTMGGPPPIGPKRAKLSPLIRDVIAQFAYQEIGHLRFIFYICHNFCCFFFFCYLTTKSLIY